MIADALMYLSAQATSAAAPQRVETDDPWSVTYAVNGRLEKVDKPSRPRAHKPGDLDALIALANHLAEDPENAPVVWHDADAVVVVVNDHDRVERATLSLEKSDVFARLERLAAGKEKFDQKAFVRLLRIELAGTLDPVVLLNPVRRVKFLTESTASGTVRTGAESMGREISSRVEADGEPPEDVTLSAPVYKTPGLRAAYPVRCSVEVDPGEGTFRLLPLPDELERVKGMAVAAVAAALAEGLKGVPAYHGKP